MLEGGKIFTKLDLSQAYQKLKLDAESQRYLVINTHKGLFRYTIDKGGERDWKRTVYMYTYSHRRVSLWQFFTPILERKATITCSSHDIIGMVA